MFFLLYIPTKTILFLQAFLVTVQVSMIFFACARRQNWSILQFDSDLSQMDGNQQQLVKGPT